LVAQVLKLALEGRIGLGFVTQGQVEVLDEPILALLEVVLDARLLVFLELLCLSLSFESGNFLHQLVDV